MHNSLEQTNGRSPAYIGRLRQLPGELPPPYNWQEFRRRSAARGSRKSPVSQLPPVTQVSPVSHVSSLLKEPPVSKESRGELSWRYMAAAAALLLMVCGIAVWARVGGGFGVQSANNTHPGNDAHPGNSDQSGTGMGGAYPDLQKDTGAHQYGIAVNGAASVAASAATRSRAIESWLASLPREPAVVHVGTRSAVARLEDRIAQVDDLLTTVRLDGVQPDRLAELQRERTRLVGSLAQVRYAEVVAADLP